MNDETNQLDEDEAGGVFNVHQFPLTYLGRADGGRKWWQCRRCAQEFTEETPTCYPGCCVTPAEAERQNDAYMERGQPGGRA